jgi:hypothetical protein
MPTGRGRPRPCSRRKTGINGAEFADNPPWKRAAAKVIVNAWMAAQIKKTRKSEKVAKSLDFS